MGGKPCIRGMRVTVGMIVGAMAAGRTVEELLVDFPYLEEADIREALSKQHYSRRAKKARRGRLPDRRGSEFGPQNNAQASRRV
jgi:uncharacterized protein (DUF433 family)